MVKETVDKGRKWKQIILIFIGVFILITLIVGISVGFSNIKKFIMWTFIIILCASLLFMLSYLFWLLFIKVEYKDIPAQWRKKLEIASDIAPNEMLGKLYISGDEKHNRLCLGKYKYLRIYLPKFKKIPVKEEIEVMIGKKKVIKKVNKLDEEGKPILKEVIEQMPLDCFIIQRKGFFQKLFESPIFVLTYPEDHDFSSIFNDVVLKGFNLISLDNYFYTLDKHNLDADMHKALEMLYNKEAIWETYRDLDKMIKGAINLDSRHAKEKEKTSEFEIPTLEKYKGDK